MRTSAAAAYECSEAGRIEYQSVAQNPIGMLPGYLRANHDRYAPPNPVINW